MTNKHAAKLSALAAKARMEKISPEKRREIGRKAAKARWKGHSKKRPASL